MNHIVWSVGGTGVLLAGIATLWLHRPLEPTALHARADPAPALTAPPRGPTGPRPLPPHARAPPPEEAPPAPTLDLPHSVSRDEASPPSRIRARRAMSPERARLVTALRAPHATPDARREAVLSELVATGDSGAPWTQEALAALGSWREQVEAAVLPVRAEPARCFNAGCVARVTFPDTASFDAAFQRTAGLDLGTASAHLQLPPERLPTGEVVASWVVLRPDAP